MSTNGTKIHSLIGSRLKSERERRGLSQTAFGEVVGVKKGTVVNWEKDSSYPDAGQLTVMAGIGIDVMFVMFGVATNKAEEDATAYMTPSRVLAQQIAVLQLSTEDAEMLFSFACRLAGKKSD